MFLLLLRISFIVCLLVMFVVVVVVVVVRLQSLVKVGESESERVVHFWGSNRIILQVARIQFELLLQLFIVVVVVVVVL